jgi:hypothetical protein
MELSQYVHTYPLSVDQQMKFIAGDEESWVHLFLPLKYSIIFFVKAIDGMVRLFPESDTELDDKLLKIMGFWRADAKDWSQ